MEYKRTRRWDEWWWHKLGKQNWISSLLAAKLTMTSNIEMYADEFLVEIQFVFSYVNSVTFTPKNGMKFAHSELSWWHWAHLKFPANKSFLSEMVSKLVFVSNYVYESLFETFLII